MANIIHLHDKYTYLLKVEEYFNLDIHLQYRIISLVFCPRNHTTLNVQYDFHGKPWNVAVTHFF